MKKLTIILRNRIFPIVLLCISHIVCAQEKTIEVTESGGLGTLLTDVEKSSTTKLTVTTADGVVLNAEDFAYLNSMPKLKELDLSGDLNTKDMPGAVFQNNTSIETIKLPGNVQTWGGGSFCNCALKGVVEIPSSVVNQNVFVSRFDNCQGITGFAFPDNGPEHVLQAVDGVILYNQGTQLMKYPCGKEGDVYEIPEGVQFIAQQAFGDNHKLKKLVFPSTVNSFQNETAIIRNSTALESFEVDPANTYLGDIDGILYKKQTRTLFLLPPAMKVEELRIDGSQIDTVPSGFFKEASTLKRVVFTEGIKYIGYTAFKPGNNGSVLEYVELPASLDTIANEAFHACQSLKQVICKGSVPPRLGTVVFRDANGEDVRVGVPAEALDVYKASKWNNAVGGGTQQSFPSEQIVAYRTITMVGGTAEQDVCVPGFQVKVMANESMESKAFSGWTSEPAGVVFTNSSAQATYFTMPDYDVVITATYAEAKPYVIIGATVSKSGEAGIGSQVALETAAMKVVDGKTYYFKRWQVNKGNVTIANPELAVTSFVMVDEEVEIEAVYQVAYLINITGGSAPIDAFEGDVVTIVAAVRPDMEFVGWTTTTEGVLFKDAAAETTTFVMPGSDVEITANFKDIDETAIVFVEGDNLCLYPNPATDYVILDGVANVNYVIYNMAGNVIMSGLSENGVVSIRNLPKGIYLFRIAEFSWRFIKK